jgi:signal transduction histidine kinase
VKVPSIQRTLLIRCGVGVGLLMCLLSLGIYFTVQHGLFKELDESVRQSAATLSNQVELENEQIIFEWQEGIGTNLDLQDRALFQYWNESDGTTTRSPALQHRDLPQFCGPSGTPRIMDIHLPESNRPARAIGMRIYPFVLPQELERMKSQGPLIDPKSLPHLLVVARDAAPIYEVLLRLRWILGLGTFVTLGVGFTIIQWAVRDSLLPIADLARQVRETRERELDPKLLIPGSLPAELIGLTQDFEALLDRLSATRQRERDFIRHAAHELRTPIAGLLATTELALSKERDAPSYEEKLRACKQSAEDLSLLVRRLSALSRIGKEDPVETSPLDLTDLLHSTLNFFEPRLAPRGLSVDCQLPTEPVIALADRSLTRLVCNNLLDNAICYSREDGTIQVRLTRVDAWIEMEISNAVDTPLEDPERFFEPLFRETASRTDASTHLGIGLTLSRDAASAMQGSLEVARSSQDRISFVFRIPGV